MKKIAIFASGNGSNAENIIKNFHLNEQIKVVSVASNNPLAKVLYRSKKYSIDTFVFNKTELNSGVVLKKLKKLKVDFIVLAGFLIKIPLNIIKLLLIIFVVEYLLHQIDFCILISNYLPHFYNNE